MKSKTTWVLLAGLPASGKSTLARALMHRLDAITLDKDRIREALFSGGLTDYSEEQDDLCIRAILDAAEYLTAHRRADFILLDGRTFSRRKHVEEVLRAAERAKARWRILQLRCAPEVAEARLSQNDPEHPARNRNLPLYRRIEQRFEPIDYPKLDVDTSSGLDPRLEEIERYLKEPPSVPSR